MTVKMETITLNLPVPLLVQLNQAASGYQTTTETLITHVLELFSHWLDEQAEAKETGVSNA